MEHKTLRRILKLEQKLAECNIGLAQPTKSFEKVRGLLFEEKEKSNEMLLETVKAKLALLDNI